MLGNHESGASTLHRDPRAAILLPEDIRALTEVLLAGTMPVIVSASLRAAIQFPEKVGSLANGLF
jgi:hypothetical protein